MSLRCGVQSFTKRQTSENVGDQEKAGPFRGVLVPAGFHDGLDLSGILAWDGGAEIVEHHTLTHLIITVFLRK